MFNLVNSHRNAKLNHREATFHTAKQAKIKKSDISNFAQEMKSKEFLHVVHGTVNWYF